MPSKMALTAASVERSRSVSSMRSRNFPPCFFANRYENKAVRAPPMCRKPVGLGAKRVTTDIDRPLKERALLAEGLRKLAPHDPTLRRAPERRRLRLPGRAARAGRRVLDRGPGAGGRARRPGHGPGLRRGQETAQEGGRRGCRPQAAG